MSLRNTSLRVLRRPLTHSTQCLNAQIQPRLTHRAASTARSTAKAPPVERLDPITLHRLESERRAYYKRRSYYAAGGVLFGMLGIYFTATSIDLEKYPPSGPAKPSSETPSRPSGVARLDSPGRADDPLVVLGRERKVVVQKLGEEAEEIPDVVQTGTSTIPTFPRVLDFVDDVQTGHPEGLGRKGENALVEYQLLGVGLRTVTFLGIEVYVVGMYIATEDIAKLQKGLIEKVAKGASSLVKGEKEDLRRKLYDPVEGTKIWSELLKDTGVRTLVRIVPCKDTDFGHLRDAYVRVLTEKARNGGEEYAGEEFGEGVQTLKGMFNRGGVPKGKELLLARDGRGKLVVWYDDGKKGAQRLGEVRDERVGRALWLNYVSGRKPASEPARGSIVDGIMEFVERPVGTVATQVQLQKPA
ncbi:hypothetical protein WAI453_000846 [Rhynchosporium graminicola]|uniref:Related to FMP22 Found in Mitochondrial Proteome n=1 Tax=Rhynchosporium graminicola TaxID=2792576 RepID=A0A1E1K928_9HELO|nr:related to FMP22 Found in Mitochondrial Proteome [Rhynchosporium commune]